jgi:transglutaminase-like putative cysteine protease
VIWRLRHTTSYGYAEPVDLAAHLAHLLPRPLEHQQVRAAALYFDPTPARETRGTDHFGNHLAWLFLDRPHDRFSVTSEAEVEVEFPPPPDAHETTPWEAIAGVAPRAPEAAEFVFDSPLLPADSGARGYASPSFTPGRPVLAAMLELNARIRRDFAFRAGVTTVNTPVSSVLAARAGVCQDFTHLMIAALRAHGIPARYVSGYIRTRAAPGRERARGADQSHAWVAAWMGAQDGWVMLDPTNDCVVRDEHVVLGWGRDFGDVSPLRGVILGGGEHTLNVAVDLEPA